MPVQVDEDIGRKGVELALARGILVQIFPQAPVAEIPQQEQSAVQVAREDLRRREPASGRISAPSQPQDARNSGA